MDAESTMIQQQMEETRNSLSEKLETLEQQVAENVQEASRAVTDSVDTIKETVGAVQETVAAVKETVEETVANVKGSVADTVTSVKDTFDLSLQVREHPWMMVGASVFVGYWVGSQPSSAATSSSSQLWGSGESIKPIRGEEGIPENPEHGPLVTEHAERTPFNAPRMVSGEEIPSRPQPQQWQWLQNLLEAFQPEIRNLQEMAVGAVAGAVGEMIADALPPRFKPEVTQMVDRVRHRFTDDSGSTASFR